MDTVYYFSGTGNSFVVAKDIAEKIDADLVSIAAVVREEKVCISADVLGVGFLITILGCPILLKIL